ncbi:MAG: bifunctional adenosylcobinamide kinase/adenosylcobinamide-phosphate guanylyltransferase, partial [Actinomycetota bacterium]|nr:bifunctional adenosylcobinamide kinase/adenosylcobinamide-phosphate guanylyltransferase [Actinomycetota bacterium]
MATGFGDRVLYVATANISGDEDLARRVREHRERRPASWGTVEADADLAAALEGAEDWDAALVDSLTLWVSARMFAGESEEETLRKFGEFLGAAEKSSASLILVSDEVGFGVVPE